MTTKRQRLGGTKNRAAREKALLSAASRLFARRGYEATTTREIAAEAGCAEGLIHRYFQSKAGLLLGLIRSRMSREIADINVKVRVAATLEADLLQVVDHELQRMWDDREFLKVVIPRAFLDANLGDVVRKTGPVSKSHLLVKRFRHFRECKDLSSREIEALAEFVGTIGFSFGFMRPAVLGDDRAHCRVLALTLARILLRAVPGKPIAPRKTRKLLSST